MFRNYKFTGGVLSIPAAQCIVAGLACLFHPGDIHIALLRVAIRTVARMAGDTGGRIGVGSLPAGQEIMEVVTPILLHCHLLVAFQAVVIPNGSGQFRGLDCFT
jgi:hypothetical protein